MINESVIRDSMLCDPPVRMRCRPQLEARALTLSVNGECGTLEVHLGDTIVRATVSGEIVSPTPERPNEGRVFFSIERSALDQFSKLGNSNSRFDAAGLCTYVERIVRGSKAIEPESLCILGGRSVWSIRCDMRVVSDDENLSDACALAALCAIAAFRRDSIELHGNTATVHEKASREQIPMSIHHIPIPSTLGCMVGAGQVRWFVDPCREEENCLDGIVSLAVNQHGELCAFNKMGGSAISYSDVSELIELGTKRAGDVVQKVRSSLSA